MPNNLLYPVKFAVSKRLINDDDDDDDDDDCLCKRKGMSHDHDQAGCWEWSCELNKNHVVFFGGVGDGADS